MKGEMKHGNTYHQLIIINLGIIEERLFQSQLYVTTWLGQMVTVHQIVSRNIGQDWNEDISKVWEEWWNCLCTHTNIFTFSYLTYFINQKWESSASSRESSSPLWPSSMFLTGRECFCSVIIWQWRDTFLSARCRKFSHHHYSQQQP